MSFWQTDGVSSRANDYELAAATRSGRYFFRPLRNEKTTRALEVVYGGVEFCGEGFAVDRASFPMAALELVVLGRGRLEIDGRRSELRAGSMFLYGPGVPLRIRGDGESPMQKYFVCWRGGSGALVKPGGVEPGQHWQVPQPARLQRVWEALLEEGQSTRPVAGEICRGLLETILRMAGDGGDVAAGGGAEQTFQRCRELIDAEACNLRTAGDLIRLTGVESAHLCRLFKRFEGTSPHRYLMRRKMLVAASGLMREGWLVKEAAHRVGMDDPYHFSRLFKQVHGVAPLQFRNSFAMESARDRSG